MTFLHVLLSLPVLLSLLARGYVAPSSTTSLGLSLPAGLNINDPCQENYQCNGTVGAICTSRGLCACPFKEVVSEALGGPRCFHPVRTLYDMCEVDEQCQRAILNSHCSSAGLCTCYHGYMYFWSSGTCAVPPGPDISKAQEVYKTAMAAAACTLIALVGIFVGCVVKKTFCTAQSPSRPHPNRLTSIAESVASVGLDKPPSYDEIMMTCVTPPPDYRDLRVLFGLPLTPTGAGGEFFPRAPPYFSMPQVLEVPSCSRSTQVDSCAIDHHPTTPGPSSATPQYDPTTPGPSSATPHSTPTTPLSARTTPPSAPNPHSDCATPQSADPTIPSHK